MDNRMNWNRRDFIALTGAGFAAFGMGMLESTTANENDEKEPIMERKVVVQHVSLEIKTDFEEFTQALEQSLARFDVSLLEGLDIDPRAVEQRIRETAGEDGLMMFNVRDHGQLLNIFGASKKAKQYVSGKPSHSCIDDAA